MLLVLTAAKSTILDEPEVPGKIKLPLIWVLDVGPSRKAEADGGRVSSLAHWVGRLEFGKSQQNRKKIGAVNGARGWQCRQEDRGRAAKERWVEAIIPTL